MFCWVKVFLWAEGGALNFVEYRFFIILIITWSPDVVLCTFPMTKTALPDVALMLGHAQSNIIFLQLHLINEDPGLLSMSWSAWDIIHEQRRGFNTSSVRGFFLYLSNSNSLVFSMIFSHPVSEFIRTYRICFQMKWTLSIHWQTLTNSRLLFSGSFRGRCIYS